MKLPVGETLKFRSGQYIQIDVPKYDEIRFSDFDIAPEYREDWDQMKMWGLVTRNPEPTFRAYSMANHPAEGNIIMLNIRIATPPWDRTAGSFMKVNPGICSSYIFSLKPGDKVTISGPYGEFFVKDTPNEKMFIGGGARYGADALAHFPFVQNPKGYRSCHVLYGAALETRDFLRSDFEEIEKQFPNFHFHIALSDPKEEDNWSGYVGLSTKSYLKTTSKTRSA